MSIGLSIGSIILCYIVWFTLIGLLVYAIKKTAIDRYLDLGFILVIPLVFLIVIPAVLFNIKITTKEIPIVGIVQKHNVTSVYIENQTLPILLTEAKYYVSPTNKFKAIFTESRTIVGFYKSKLDINVEK